MEWFGQESMNQNGFCGLLQSLFVCRHWKCHKYQMHAHTNYPRLGYTVSSEFAVDL